MGISDLQVWMVGWPIPLQVLPNEGNRPTQRLTNSRRRVRALDHVAYWGVAEEGVPSAQVLEDWDISDHFPVMVDIPSLKSRPSLPTAASGSLPEGSLPRVVVPNGAKRQEIISSNSGQCLLKRWKKQMLNLNLTFLQQVLPLIKILMFR